MAQEIINLGADPNDDTGDDLREGGAKINNNFSELYGLLPAALESATLFAHPFDLRADLVAVAGEMPEALRAEVSAEDTGTHAAIAGEIDLGGGGAVVGALIPNAGLYEKQPGGELWRVGDLDSQAASLIVDKLGVIDNMSFSQSGYAVAFGAGGSFWWGTENISGNAGFVVPGFKELDPASFPKTAMNFGGAVHTFVDAASFSQSGMSFTYMDAGKAVIAGFGASPHNPVGAWSPFRTARPEYVPGAAFDAFTRRDANGYMLVWSRDKSNGTVRQLSNSGVDAMNLRIDAAGKRAVWQTSGGDAWKSDNLRARRLDKSFGISYAYPNPLNLVAWGDSVDGGTGSTGGILGYSNLTATALSLTLTMRAIGGMQIWQQAMLGGVLPIDLNITGTSVVTGAGTTVNSIDTTAPDGTSWSCTVVGMSGVNLWPNTLCLSTPADATTRTIYGYIADSTGALCRAQLKRVATGVPSTVETYTIISLFGATITTASSTIRFIPDNDYQLQYPAILGAGLNDLGQGLFATNRTPPSAATILSYVRSIQDAQVNALGPAFPCFLIMGLYNQASATFIAGSAADLAIIAHNADRASAYPMHFVDRFAILAAGGDGSANDNADIANRYPPRSKRASAGVDIIHPNDAGYALIANGNAGGLGTIAKMTALLTVLPE